MKNLERAIEGLTNLKNFIIDVPPEGEGESVVILEDALEALELYKAIEWMLANGEYDNYLCTVLFRPNGTYGINGDVYKSIKDILEFAKDI